MSYLSARITLWIFIALFSGYCAAEEVCQSCHQTQVTEWQSSHHFNAMNEATDAFVLGAFDGTKINYQDQTLVVVKDNDGFWLESEKDGSKSRQKIQYTFGYHPLQQYLVKDDNGGFQFVPVAWDSRIKQDGGQRWFVLHPEQQPHQEFHPTQMGQNWNHMCADCHSTDFKKNYSPETNQFASSFTRINVSCKACHGDAEAHLEWASGGSDSSDKGFKKPLSTAIAAFRQNESGAMEAVGERHPSEQIQVCATCHSRRAQLKDRTSSFDYFDVYSPALITNPIYYADGQILDEDYVWGSFLQSKMHKAGVTCTNCHNPHSGKLTLTGNQTCTQCHAASTFDNAQHHGHPESVPGSQCVNCHMPETTFMQIDARRDHSLRVPRPDLTEQTGAPNACNSCHSDKTPAWATKAILAWHPDSVHIGAPHFAQAFHAAENRLPNASQQLSRIAQDSQYNAIIRASALARLADYPDSNAVLAISRAVRDDEPLKRLGAISAAQSLPLPQRVALLSPLLTDSRLAIRSAAGRALAPVLTTPDSGMSTEQLNIIKEVVEEYRQTQRYQSERGSSHTNLGNLALALNQPEQAEAHYRKAIDVEPIFIPAYVNLAELMRQQNQEADARAILEGALPINQGDPDVHYALAMSWVRDKQREKALGHLQQSASSGHPRYIYTYALLLNEMGQKSKALTQLEKAYEADKNNPDTTYLLVQWHMEQKNSEKALKFAHHLAELLPQNPQVRALVERLELLQYVEKDS